ncbi:hypothetical protein CAP31_11530 [Sulfuriferula sp. AH1]|uniref:DUF4936 family protein n=1 Tax=Sulfuriferula sp. AH1 TaxID=1985873 RepID=UPI000B3B6590|nr:DUF4936 family protein [Sulfuriferula sp. AH1]ARU32248.1 hypothetical protein CAP31_11530 [Sulfuriferula sp. AH1]
MLHYYIYYRVHSDDPETEQLIRGMQVRLGCRSGQYGNLVKRRDDPLTWMEIYEHVSDSATFEQQLARAVAEFDVEMFINGSRVTECFSGELAPTAHCRA